MPHRDRSGSSFPCACSSSTTSPTSATRSPFASRERGPGWTRSAPDSAALEALRLAPYDLAFCDLRLGQESGLDLIPRLLAERPGLDVVVITAFATFDTAVEAIRRGARDYLPKPFTPAQVRHQLEAARQRRATASRLDDLESAARRRRARRPARIGIPPRPRHAGDAHEGGSARRIRAAPRRERHGQGRAGPGPPRGQPPARAAVRGGELPDPLRGAAGERALRPRPRLVHGRDPRPARPHRGRGGRHGVPGRDRRHLPLAPGQAPPLPAGEALRADRREPDPRRRRARRRGDQPRPGDGP